MKQLIQNNISKLYKYLGSYPEPTNNDLYKSSIVQSYLKQRAIEQMFYADSLIQIDTALSFVRPTTRKLRACCSPEMVQDLATFYTINPTISIPIQNSIERIYPKEDTQSNKYIYLHEDEEI